MPLDSSGLLQGGVSAARSMDAAGGQLAQVNLGKLQDEHQLNQIQMKTALAAAELASKKFDFDKATQAQDYALKQRQMAEEMSQFNRTYDRLKETADLDVALKKQQLGAGPAPLSPEGKMMADEARGLIPKGTFASKAQAAGVKQLTPAQAAQVAGYAQAKNDFDLAKSYFFNKDGSFNKGAAASANVPFTNGLPGSKGREGRIAMQRALMAKLRADTGAAITNEEMVRYESMFMPSMYDSEETIKDKFGALENFITGAGSLAKSERAGITKDTVSTTPDKEAASHYTDSDYAKVDALKGWKAGTAQAKHRAMLAK